MNPVGVRNVHSLLVGAEANTIRPAKAIGHGPNRPTDGIISVNLIGKLRLRPDTLLIAINRVGEPQRAVTVHHNVVDRVELPSVERVDHHTCLVGRFRLHKDQASRRGVRALGAEDDPVQVVDTSVGHRYDGGVDLLTFCLGTAIGRQCDAADLDLAAAGCMVVVLVASDEEGVVTLDEDACLVSERIVLVLVQQLERRCGAEQLLDSVVVDPEVCHCEKLKMSYVVS